jgi:alpha-galactosidase
VQKQALTKDGPMEISSHGLDSGTLPPEQPDAFLPGAIPKAIALIEKEGRLVARYRWGGTEVKLSEPQILAGTLRFSMTSFWGREHRSLRLSEDDARLKVWNSEQAQGKPDFLARRISPLELKRIEAAAPKVTQLRPLPLPAPHAVPANDLALRPPMGWSSYNSFADSINDSTVRAIADALVDSGLRDAGYVYVNIDDGWQGIRDAQGTLHANSKFPDMKGLGDYLHAKGLKFGIYSSPGPLTCGEYLGSHGHEEQDAHTFASWGVDYLKYDWCSAGILYTREGQMQAVYQKMGEALQTVGRPIVYSLGTEGLLDAEQWGRRVGGNLWRTTSDINDSWATMSHYGFSQSGYEAFAGPGGWNDPDMLEVGNGGMTLEEYRTHMTLWAILSAPLILGNDVRDMTPQTQDLLKNAEVVAIDQDALGKQGHRSFVAGAVETWIKPLADGSTAVAIFNTGSERFQWDVPWYDMGLFNVMAARDLWQHADLTLQRDTYHADVPPHGAVLLRVTMSMEQSPTVYRPSGGVAP